MNDVPIESTLAGVPDGELVPRAAHGDGVAFAAIMRRYNRRLFRTARAILGNDADAEDALQEGYLHAWRALGSFRAEARLSTWLTRIVANEALARRRRQQPGTVTLDDAMTDAKDSRALVDGMERRPESVTARDQWRRLIEQGMDRLPEPFRTVFMLRGVEELSVDEVARVLDIPEATVRTRFFRARALLRKELTGEVGAALRDAFAFDGARCDRMVAAVMARGRAEGLAAPIDHGLHD